MKIFNKTILASALGLAAAQLSGGAVAAPAFGDGLNNIFFNNFENIYRLDANCTAATCLGVGSGPAGYQLATPDVPNNIQVGDVISGIFNVQNIESGGATTWFAGAQDQFTGYFAQEVAFVAPTDSGTQSTDPYSGLLNEFNHIQLTNPAVDPFGILGAGEMFALYVDEGVGTTPFTSNGDLAGTSAAPGTLLGDILNATDGTLWATLGVGALAPVPGIDTDGYFYSHIDLDLVQANFSDQAAFGALDIVMTGPAYNAGTLALINDSNEDEVGGAASAPATGTCVGVPPIACNQIVGTSELEGNANSTFLGGNSPWVFASNDPFTLFTAGVPEPGTIALMGLGLAGLAGVRRRRKS
jgi:hypothetical protein